MKIIETEYKGRRFRSRTEARFAVAFETLGEVWEYENEGFDLDGEWYLPDFWLPARKMFVEVKGQWPTKREIRLCRKLQFETGFDVAICYGMPSQNETILFSRTDENGGQFIETFVPWPWASDSAKLDKAIRKAIGSRFEYGASRLYPNIVDYDHIAF